MFNFLWIFGKDILALAMVDVRKIGMVDEMYYPK